MRLNNSRKHCLSQLFHCQLKDTVPEMTAAPHSTAIAARFDLARSIATEAAALALDYFNRRETLVIET